MNKRSAKKKAPTSKKVSRKRKAKEPVFAPRSYNGKTIGPIETMRKRVVTDAEATIKFAIFDGIVDQWNKKDDPGFVQAVRDKVFETIFVPSLRWAIEEHLETLK